MVQVFLIYGWRGWIGGQFVELLQTDESIRVVLGLSRVENIHDVMTELKYVNPTHVVSFIGRTHGTIGDKEYTTIDYLEQPGKLTENVRDNLFSPIVLANLSVQMGFHYTYMGTGCIFQYDECHPYGKEECGFDESSLPNFFGSGYSVVKGFTDQLMHMYEDTTLNVRIRMPITADLNPRNFITKILSYSKICSVPNSMTVLPELLPILVDMVKAGRTGTINLCNPGLVSHNEILEMYRETIDPTLSWGNFSEEEQNALLAAGRSNNYLNTDKLESIHPSVKDIRTSVRDVINRIHVLAENV